ncbi:hypothetical protein [Dictyobacter arantiisoli]|uniref:Uncharacterized protein n=1 Tax=Dictyobacter arantiisoli TaxID=2014874 RepID=A0A5A5TFT3_9CHLR|nr:hypothetical protein [Dictyobacter arantiisoli]GCF10431.1 hypothetical protein KDI_39950 [Dictyobacter arantiisoli]
MAAEGEQPTSKRRMRTDTGSHNPRTSYSNTRSNSRVDMSPITGGYNFDEGMINPSRSTSVRYNTQSQRYTGSQPVRSPVPARQGVTRDIPLQMRPTGHTGRQPHIPLPPPASYSPNNTTRPVQNITRSTPTTNRPVRNPNPNTRSKEVTPKAARRVHWLLPAGVGMVAMLVLWMLGSSALVWGTDQYNNYKYGYPRTSHTDALVGHGDSAAHPSSFTAINYNHQAVVIEFKGGDASKSVSYVFNLVNSDNVDRAPITLSFKDLNGDNSPDMIIHVHTTNQDEVSVFINDVKHQSFRPYNSNTDKLTAPIN